MYVRTACTHTHTHYTTAAAAAAAIMEKGRLEKSEIGAVSNDWSTHLYFLANPDVVGKLMFGVNLSPQRVLQQWIRYFMKEAKNWFVYLPLQSNIFRLKTTFRYQISFGNGKQMYSVCLSSIWYCFVFFLVLFIIIRIVAVQHDNKILA